MKEQDSMKVVGIICFLFMRLSLCAETFSQLVAYPSPSNITSTNYPDPYPPNENCSWTIVAPAGHRIQLTIGDIDIECGFDFLTLSEPIEGRDRRVTSYCGTQLPQPYISSTNIVTVTFTSDGSVQKKGFLLTYDARVRGVTLTPETCGNRVAYPCPTDITSLNYPDNYTDYDLCVWTIQAPLGERVQLIVHDMDIEVEEDCDYDYLEFRESIEGEDDRVIRYCGTQLPQPYVSSNNSVTVTFKTDDSVQGKGFLLTFEANYTDIGLPPWPSVVADNGFCDTSSASCIEPVLEVTVTGAVYDTVNLTCKFRQITVDEIGPLLTGPTTEVPGRYFNCSRVACPVPNDRIPTLDGRAVAGWLISISNDGIAYGAEGVYIPHDGRCVSCNKTCTRDPVCTWAMDQCYIGGVCYANGETSSNLGCYTCNVTISPTQWLLTANNTDTGLPPWSTVVADNGFCDTSSASCIEPVLEVTTTRAVDDTVNLTCKFRQIAVDEIGPLLTGPTTKVPGRYIDCNRLACPVPNDTIPILDGRAVAGWLISISNDGIAYGAEGVYIPHDGRCVSCNKTCTRDPVCTWAMDQCFIGGMCYANGEISSNSGCNVCNVTISPIQWSLPGTNCTIGGKCYADGAVNPSDGCQSCDLATSPSSWSSFTFDLKAGGNESCSTVCLHVRNDTPGDLELVCSGPVSQGMFDSVCYLQDYNALSPSTCTGYETTMVRWIAMCLSENATAARINHAACP